MLTKRTSLVEWPNQSPAVIGYTMDKLVLLFLYLMLRKRTSFVEWPNLQTILAKSFPWVWIETQFSFSGWIRRINSTTLTEEFVRSVDGHVAPTLECATSKFFVDASASVRRQRKNPNPKHLLILWPGVTVPLNMNLGRFNWTHLV